MIKETPHLVLIMSQAMAFRSESIQSIVFLWVEVLTKSWANWNHFGQNISICSSSAPYWQTSPVHSSLQPHRTPGEKPLTVASQEQQGESLPLCLLTPRGQEAESCHASKRALPETEEPRVQVRSRRSSHLLVYLETCDRYHSYLTCRVLSHVCRKLSAEELERKRREMMDEAMQREEDRENNVKRYKRQDEQERQREQNGKRERNAGFIQ